MRHNGVRNSDEVTPGFSPVVTRVLLALGLACVGITTLLRMIYKPFWYDELVTIAVCGLKSPSEIVLALYHGADSMPPPAYAMYLLGGSLASDMHVGYRLPSLAGLLVAIVCVHMFLSLRVDGISAATAAAFLACTALADYGYEARPYAPMVGFIAIAICAWQRLDRSRWWACLVAACLALAVSSHYYAVFVWPAFVAAESLITVRERRLRLAMWAALLVGGIPFVACYPLLSQFRAMYGQHFFATAKFAVVYSAPQFFFKVSGGMWGPALLLAMIVWLGLWWIQTSSARASTSLALMPRSPLRSEECVLLMGLLAIPFLVFTVARLTGGGATERYMIPFVLGGAVTVGAIASTMPTALRLVALLVVLLNYGLMARPVVATWTQGRLLAARQSLAQRCEEVADSERGLSVPIIVSSAQYYMQLQHYASPEAKPLLRALADPGEAIALSAEASDTVDRNILVLAPYVGLQLRSYEEFRDTANEFVLVSNGDPSEWVPAKLLQDAHAMTLMKPMAGGKAYRVVMHSR